MLLNAALCVWNEEDIIESTIKHLFAQGCSHVFIVDNASADNTVGIAKDAGAVLANSFESKYFNEFEKTAHLNTIIKNYNEQSDEDSIWWLYVDADEFPNVNLDMTLKEFVESLDISIRAVHGHIFEHVPSHPPYFVPGYHPIDFQQLCTKVHNSKIPLLRYDKNKPHLYSSGGAHGVDTYGESLVVMKDILDIHHFNYRKQETVLRRLKLLMQQNDRGETRLDWLDKREQRYGMHLKSMYHARYERAKSIYDENKYTVLMEDELPYSYGKIARWYDPYELHMHGEILSQALHHYFLRDYGIALFKFIDLLRETNDSKLHMLLAVKIALCLCFTDKNEALSILQPVVRCPDREIREYAEKALLKITGNETASLDKTEINVVVESYRGHFDHKFFV